MFCPSDPEENTSVVSVCNHQPGLLTALYNLPNLIVHFFQAERNRLFVLQKNKYFPVIEK